MLFSYTTRFTNAFLFVGFLWSVTALNGQVREDLKEPVYRVVNTNSAAAERPSAVVRPQLDKSVVDAQAQPAVQSAVLATPVLPAAAPPNKFQKHPALLAALDDASQCLTQIQASVKDYECLLIRRENVNGKLLDPEYISAKIRQRQMVNGKVTVPFSVYLKYRKPSTVKGREVLFVEGENNGKMLVKEGGGGFKARLPSMWLATNSALVMKSCRYPISDIGLENLTRKLIERGGANDGNVAEKDYTASYRPGAKLNGRECSYLRVDFTSRKPQNEASRLDIFIDREMMTPIRYVAFGWPEAAGSRAPLMEEYTYLNIKLNNNFDNATFSQNNPNYNF